MMREDEISKIERARKQALRGWDGARYAKLCDELGISPEVPELYEQGLVDLGITSYEKDSNAQSIDVVVEATEMPPQDIAEFLDYARHLPTDDIFSSPLEKRIALQTFEKFRPGGRQDITDYSDAKVGKVFKNVYVNYARKYPDYLTNG
ncbi:hypothetical protein KY320_03820 [Candidatus Woesearchaeota archaeon]|nr:hypothetical protein [Candidatus Woesearchaeota archaeon]